MVVVGRIDIHEVDVELGRELVRVLAENRPAWPRDQLGHPKVEVVVGSRSPSLQKCHLQAGGAVDAVGGLEQRGEHDPALDRRELVAVDRRSDRVDPPAIVRLDVAGAAAERLREVPLAAGKCGKLRQHDRQPGSVDRFVRRDIGVPQRLRVGGEVVRDDFDPKPSQRLPDPGRAGEEVAGRPHRQQGCSEADQRHQRPFRADVLDHRRATARAYAAPRTAALRLTRPGIPGLQ